MRRVRSFATSCGLAWPRGDTAQTGQKRAGTVRLREDMNAGFRRHDEELAKFREDMNRGFMLVGKHISALGARWGLMAEEASRQSIKGLVEKEFGFKVECWTKLDREGVVFGYKPSGHRRCN